ncbi:hypothetical protein CTA2_7219, partial [Colletotrichum tanaceti]
MTTRRLRGHHAMSSRRAEEEAALQRRDEDADIEGEGDGGNGYYSDNDAGEDTPMLGPADVEAADAPLFRPPSSPAPVPIPAPPVKPAKPEPVSWSDLPKKQQLLIITLTRLSEPLVQTSLQVRIRHPSPLP